MPRSGPAVRVPRPAFPLWLWGWQPAPDNPRATRCWTHKPGAIPSPNCSSGRRYPSRDYSWLSSVSLKSHRSCLANMTVRGQLSDEIGSLGRREDEDSKPASEHELTAALEKSRPALPKRHGIQLSRQHRRDLRHGMHQLNGRGDRFDAQKYGDSDGQTHQALSHRVRGPDQQQSPEHHRRFNRLAHLNVADDSAGSPGI